MKTDYPNAPLTFHVWKIQMCRRIFGQCASSFHMESVENMQDSLRGQVQPIVSHKVLIRHPGTHEE